MLMVGVDAAFEPTGSELDLTLAKKVAARGNLAERGPWLEQMLTTEGMRPGASKSAHKRSFTFAEALRKAGYTVEEGPWGPRGGRRFRLTAFGGVHGVLLYEVKSHRSCFASDHRFGPCDCFDHLTVEQLHDIKQLHRDGYSINSTYYSTNRLAELVTHHDLETIRTAMRVENGFGADRPSLTTLCQAIEAARL